MARTIISALLFITLLGCGGTTQTSAREPESATGTSGPSECGGGCPMRVEGTTIRYEDAPDGAAMVFTTDKGDVATLQARVAAMAERHNRPGPKNHPGHVPHSARADNIEHGARLVLTAADPKDVDALRAHVREHVEQVEHGECPMMHGHGHGHGAGQGHGHGPDADHDGHHDEHHDHDGDHDEHASGGPQG